MGVSPGYNELSSALRAEMGLCILTTCRGIGKLLVPQCITVEVGLVAGLCQAHWLRHHVYDCMHLQPASAFRTDVFEFSHTTAHFQHILLA